MGKNKKAMWIYTGYSIGSLAGTSGELMSVYMSYFLITVIGINASAAGIVSGIAMVAGGLICLVIGRLSDKSKCKYGRRRPYMLALMIPTVITLVLFFTSIEMSSSAEVIYYGIMGIMFFVFSWGFFVPFESLGAELTEDYDARTLIRALCTVFNYVAVIIADSGIIMLKNYFEAYFGMSEEQGWFVAVLIAAIITLASGLIAWNCTRGKEQIVAKEEADEKEEKENFLEVSKMLFSIKSYRNLVIWIFLYATICVFLTSIVIYIGQYVIGLTESMASSYYIVSAAATLIGVPIITMLSKKIGKRNCIVLTLALYIIATIVVYVTDPDTYLDGAIVCVFFGIANGTVLTCVFSMLYDVNELCEFKFGESKPSMAMGLWYSARAFGVAFGAAILGILLDIVGFDAELAVQTTATSNGIAFIALVFPAAVLLIDMIFLMKYKINKKNYDALVEALEKKRNGEEFTTAGFEELL